MNRVTTRTEYDERYPNVPIERWKANVIEAVTNLCDREHHAENWFRDDRPAWENPNELVHALLDDCIFEDSLRDCDFSFTNNERQVAHKINHRAEPLLEVTPWHSRFCRDVSFLPVARSAERRTDVRERILSEDEDNMAGNLIQIVDAALASAAERSGPHLACRPGCTQCCHGVFPISPQDAARLREALQALDQADPQRAARIRTRTAESLARLAPLFPGDPATGILSEDYESSLLFADESEDALGENEPCPVLDPATGTCDLYAARPIVCRTFGPPMRTPEGDLATCELCFIHASTEEIAACELDPTIPAQEAASNEAFNAAHNLHGETIVAYALRGA